LGRVTDGIKRHALRTGLNVAALIFFLAHVSGYQSWEFLDRMEHLAYDARLLLTMPGTQDRRIVIVDIDEKSLAEVGRWPWSRKRLAELMDQLFDYYKVGVVGYDVVFAEPDESSGLKVLDALAHEALRGDTAFTDRLDQLRSELDYDALFAASLTGRPVILGYYFNESAGAGDAMTAGSLPPPTFTKEAFQGRQIPFLQAVGFGANLPGLLEEALGAGHFDPYVDEDGVVRRVPMLVEYRGAYYESLSLAVARTALGGGLVVAEFAVAPLSDGRYVGLETLALGGHRIPVDHRARTLVPYRGVQGSFPYVSASDVLHRRVDPQVLGDRIVLVGFSAPGLHDLRSAPVQRVFPGVEIHANLIAGILDNGIKAQPAYMLGVEWILVLLIGIVLIIAYPVLSAFWAALLTLLLTTGLVALNLYLWEFQNLVLPIAPTLLFILPLFLLNMSYGFFVESRGKRQLAELFGQYVPPELVEEMSQDPESYTLEAESRELTVLFTDVRGFTTISEQLEPKALAQLMNELLTSLTRVIHQHRGTIDKYMGDAIMAFWGAPLADPDHPRHALQAGVDMLRALGPIQRKFRARGWPDIHIGVGINTGPMRVGNMGSEFRMAYTVLGDAVNLGARLEALTRQYGVDIIVSETTSGLLPEYLYRELDRVRVKGKGRPAAIFEPVGLAADVDVATRDDLRRYHRALALYRARDWHGAEVRLLSLEGRCPHPLYRVYLDRINRFRREPPGADWDGVYTFQDK